MISRVLLYRLNRTWSICSLNYYYYFILFLAFVDLYLFIYLFDIAPVLHQPQCIVCSPLNRACWSSGSEPGHSGQYHPVPFSPLGVTGFPPSAESSPLFSSTLHFIRVCVYLDRPGPWPPPPTTPPSTDSPMRLQDSNTVGSPVQQHNNTTLQG